MKSELLKTDIPHGNIVFNFMNRPIEDLWAFAEGYHESAKTLVKNLSESKGYSDYEGYPIFFLYRHSIELYLKAILYNGAETLELVTDETIINSARLRTSHSLYKFIPVIRELCFFEGWNLEHKTKQGITIEKVLSVIEELDSIDPRSYTFRYPVNQRGRANFKSHTVINVIQFAKMLDPVLDLLASMVHFMEYNWDKAAELKHEVQVALRSED